MDNEQLVILGNGFDLALGLATSYDDFFKWIKTEDTISTIPPIKEDSSEEETAVLEQQILEDLKTKRVNVWVYYFCQLDHTLKGWNNVESVIRNVLGYREMGINFSIKTSLKMYLHGGLGSNNILINLMQLLIKELNTNDTNFFKYNSSLLVLKNVEYMFFPFLYNELVKFECLFKDYFFSEYFFSESPSISNYDNYATKLLSSMNIEMQNNNYHILDFNYTQLSNIEDKVNNIHGMFIDNNIIFGIDATKVDSNTPYYQFTKESRIMHNSLKSSLDKDILNKNIKEIKFFGHSLAEADYAYFQSIFDYLNIYDSDVTLIFYYGSYLNYRDAELNEYEHQIQKLLSIYGTTLDNKDHGKNIMTKLMLENRLQIKRINTAEF